MQQLKVLEQLELPGMGNGATLESTLERAKEIAVAAGAVRASDLVEGLKISHAAALRIINDLVDRGFCESEFVKFKNAPMGRKIIHKQEAPAQ